MWIFSRASAGKYNKSYHLRHAGRAGWMRDESRAGRMNWEEEGWATPLWDTSLVEVMIPFYPKRCLYGRVRYHFRITILHLYIIQALTLTCSSFSPPHDWTKNFGFVYVFHLKSCIGRKYPQIFQAQMYCYVLGFKNFQFYSNMCPLKGAKWTILR